MQTALITFLFTDMEGSTALWEAYPDAMHTALQRHDALLLKCMQEAGGHVFKTVGDAFCTAFERTEQAVCAALAAQKALMQEPWPEPLQIKVRMALHSGTAEYRNNDWFGPVLNRTARLLDIAHGGQIIISAAARDLLASLPQNTLLKEMGQHGLKDLSSPETVYQLIHPDLPSDFPPLRSLQIERTNLPQQLTSFVGRQSLLQHTQTLLSQTRLLTLTGSGGCGKTRLALQAAASAANRFAEGVWLVELAPLSDATLIAGEIMRVLKLHEEQGKPPIDTLCRSLKSRNMLLLLDNCEHLLAECSLLCDTLLRECKNLQILLTSRSPLQIAGEHILTVPPMQLPDRQGNMHQLENSESVALFLERVQAVQPFFEINQQNCLLAAEVCRQLDGIPFAIELAAARMRSMSLEQVAQRLNDRFHLLRSSSRTAQPRQQTLRDMINWSHDLLQPEEKTLLHRLSVFAGSFSLEACEAVCTDDIVKREDALDLLASLVDKSLVAFEGNRYRMLETMRQYAGGILKEEGEDAPFCRRHALWCCMAAQMAEEGLKGALQQEAMKSIETELDNMRAALEYCAKTEQMAEEGLSLCSMLYGFWRAHGLWTEGLEYTRKALQHPEAAQAEAARAQALNAAGNFYLMLGSYLQARAHLEEGAALFRTLADTAGLARALSHLGMLCEKEGDLTQAMVCFEESHALYLQTADVQGMAYVLRNMGWVAVRREDYETALHLYEESLSHLRSRHDLLGISSVLNHMGSMAYVQRRYAEAKSRFEESLQIMLQMGDRIGAAVVQCNLGNIETVEGCYDAAQSHYEECLATFQELGHQEGIAGILLAKSFLAMRVSKHEEALGFAVQSVQIYQSLRQMNGLIQALVSEGVALCAMERYQEAQSVLKQTLSLILKTDIHRMYHYAMRLLADIEMAAGREANAVLLYSAACHAESELEPAEYEMLEQRKTQAREILGAKVFEAAWQTGIQWNYKEAIDFALNL